MKQMKNYVGFANDHSGSMQELSSAAIRDYNANITAIKEAATREMLDTIVSVVDFNSYVTRHIVNSNPHVLKPVTNWPCSGQTALFDSVGDLIELFKSMPDYNDPTVSFLIITTTDGEENQSRKYNTHSLAAEIRQLSVSERWTFVFRVPKGMAYRLQQLGVPEGNIQEWDTTAKGIEASTAATTQAIDTFYATRSAGKKSSTVFYANANNVSSAQVAATLQDISSEVSIWPVYSNEDGAEIAPFAKLRLNGSPFLKGAAFYQLTKTEARVQDTKMIVIRDKSTKHIYHGPAARTMIGLPASGTVRLKPGDHGNYDLFIQSTSINRKLVAGTEVLYWPKAGTGFTAADFPWLATGQANAAAQAIKATANVSPSVPASNSNLYYPSRDAARHFARASGASVKDNGVAAGSKRWSVA